MIGCTIGLLLSAMNVYVGNKIGWTFGGSLIAAILSVALMKRLATARPFGVLETNIAQTAGSAAGSMASTAGLVSAIPALGMLGIKLTPFQMVVWALAVAYLGVFFAQPLRRQMIEVERLRFPTGTAAAETIVAMFSSGDEAAQKAKALLQWAFVAAVISLIFYFLPSLEHPEITFGVFATLSAWTFSLLISPVMIGAGLMIGTRVATSLVVGSIIGWGLLGPLAQDSGWVAGKIMSYKDGARGWILWTGVAIMVATALTDLLFLGPTIIRAITGLFKSKGDGEPLPPVEGEVPQLWWVGGLAIGTSLTIVLAKMFFDIPIHMTIIAVMLAALLSMIATRATGETDINPIGGMGKVTQLVFGGIAPGLATTNLMCAAITGAGANQAGDMMQDFKTGYLLGAKPRPQFIAQLIGVAAGVITCVPVYLLFDKAYEIGGEEMPSPAGHAWRAMAELLSKGADALPMHADKAIVIAGLISIVLTVIVKLSPPSVKKYLPSPMSIGIAMIIPAYYSIAMFIGAIILIIWKRINKTQAIALTFAVSSGLLAGEGLTGVLKAVMQLVGVPTLEG